MLKSVTVGTRLRLLLLAAASGLMLAACGGGANKAITLSRTLQVAYKTGAVHAYAMHMSMTTKVQVPGADGQPSEQSVVTEMRGTSTQRVLSVDKDGTATVQVDMSGLTVTVNGQASPATAQVPKSYTMTIAKDGSVRSMTAAGGSGTAGGGSAAGLDQVSPLLPGHPVKPGDTWDKTSSPTSPFTTTPLTVTTHNKYLRDESVDGSSAAVIGSTGTSTFDTSLDFAKLAQSMGIPSTSGALKGVSAHLTGDLKTTGTYWLDLANKQVVKNTSTMHFTGTEAMSGGIFGAAGRDVPIDETIAVDFGPSK